MLGAVFLFAAITLSISAASSEAGIVVESVKPSGAAHEAGIREGDLLLRWERAPRPPANPEAAEGRFESPFDLRLAEMEQAPRGPFTIHALREDEPLSFEIPSGRWHMKARPRLSDADLDAMDRLFEGIASKDAAGAIGASKALAKRWEERDPLLAAWLLYRCASVLEEEKRGEEAGPLYAGAAAAAGRANRPLVRALILEARAYACEKASEIDRAEALHGESLELRRSENPDSLSVAWSINNLGAMAWQRGDLEAASERFVEALALRERLAPGSVAAAGTLDNLGAVSWKRSRIEEAEGYFKRALAIKEKLSPGSLTVANTLNNLGAAAWMRGDLETAEAFFERAQEIRERVAPGSPGAVGGLTNLGVIAHQRGRLAEAETYFLRALDGLQALSPDSHAMANALNNLGALASEREQYERALSFYERCLKIREKLAPGSLDTATVLNNLGTAALDVGDLATAESYLRRSIEIKERLAPESPGLAMSLNNMAAVMNQRGRLALAEDHARRALKLYEDVAPESPDIASVWSTLGSIAHRRGDIDRAARCHRRQLERTERQAPDSVWVARAWNNLGSLEQDRGRLEEAGACFRRSMEIKEAQAPGGLGSAGLWINLGINGLLRGNLGTAGECFRKALAIIETHDSEGTQKAICLQQMAILALEKHHAEEAERLLKEALPIFSRLAPGSRWEASALHDLGVIARDDGRREEALRLLLRAVDAIETQIDRLGGTVTTRAAFREQFETLYRDAVDLLIELTRDGEAFHLLERSRARQLLAMMAERDLLFTADLPEGLDRERRILQNDARAAWERFLESAEGDPDAQASAREELDEIRRKQAALRREIRKASPRFASFRYPRPLNGKEARALLDPGTLLLTWSLGPKRSWLFLVTEDGIETRPVGSDRRTLAFQIRRWRDAIARQEPTDAALSLSETLLGPAADAIGKADRLLLLPEGPLHYLPFAALPLPGSDKKRLVEALPMHTAVSMTVYAELAGRVRPERETRLVAFGDPAYGPGGKPSAGEETVRGLRDDLRPLPSTRAEVEGIAALFPDRSVLYLGEGATEAHAKALTSDPSVIHFACHGLTDERFPLNSALALALPASENEEGENGLLQAWEIFESVRIDADLLVLSACDTALGKEIDGEGMVGLTRAFQYAGARSVLASLWPVADETTAAFMQRFYTHIADGLPQDEALRRAQLDFLQKPAEGDSAPDTSLPFYWAAFTLIGDGR